MAIYYPDPGPYVGGKQPYDPGRRVTPPQAPPNPPFVHPARWVQSATLYQSWQPDPAWTPILGPASGQQPYTQRQLWPKLLDNPPPPWLRKATDTVQFATIFQSWQPGPPQPQTLPPVQIAGVAQKTPFVPPWLPSVIQAWQPPDQQPTQLAQKQIVSVAVTQYVPPPANWLTTVIQAWQPPDPLPQQLPKTQIVSVDQPPRFSLAPLYEVVQSWIPGPPDPPRLSPKQIVSVDNPPSFSLAPLYAQIQPFWVPGPPQPQTLPPTQIVSVDQPPPTTNTLLYELALLWTPPDPQPYQLVQYFPTPAAVVNNPPFPGVNWTNIVIQSWQPPDPQPYQLIQNVVQEGAPSPPVPPVTPAGPTGGAPAWWGYESFDGSRRPWWYKDLKDKAEELDRQRRIRVELGILPPEANKQIKQVVRQTRSFVEQMPTPATADHYIARRDVLVDKLDRYIETLQEADDEEVILQLLMLL